MVVESLGQEQINFDTGEEIIFPAYEALRGRTIPVLLEIVGLPSVIDYGYFIVGYYYDLIGSRRKASLTSSWYPNGEGQVFGLYKPDFLTNTDPVYLSVKPISIYPGAVSPIVYTVSARTDTDDFTRGQLIL